MDIDFLEYKVRNGDTLNSIASRLGITGEELKLFHNSHCQRMDRIWFENLNEVKNVFVPIHIKTEKQKNLERKNILPFSQLSDSFFEKAYKVTEAFESPFESPLKIDYHVNLDVYKDKKQNHYILSYSQDQFTSNGNPPDATMSNLSITCMKSIMPIDIIVNDSGKITGFADHKKITENFAGKRKDLDFFVGEISERYMDTFEKNISDEIFFLRQLQSTLLFQTLFPRMEWFHRKAAWAESFYFLQNSFPVQCTMEIEQKDENQDHVTTILTGNITALYSLQELRTGNQYNKPVDDPVSGSIIIQYTTHKKNKNLLQASATINLWREAESVQKHTITITQG